MAQVLLTSIGAAIGGPFGGAVGAAVGGAVDRLAIAALAPARQGPRLTGLQIQSSAEGAPMAAVYGRARVAGEIIWRPASPRARPRAAARAGRRRSTTTIPSPSPWPCARGRSTASAGCGPTASRWT
ncbi:MAG: hypothetical protein WDM92_07350 [Caulobacteraceae bacterium]